MIGRFITRKYVSRRAYAAGHSYEVLESHNDFTNAGLQWLWKMALGQLRSADGTLTDQLSSARIVVGNGAAPFTGTDGRLAGDQTDQADMQAGYPRFDGMVDDGDADGEPDAAQVTFRAIFGEQQGIFDWQERGVVTAQGVLLDRAVTDQGRMVLGSVWEVEAALMLTR